MMTPFEFSDKHRTLRLYHYASGSGEFTGEEEILIPAHTGLPACCTPLAPPEPQDGHIALFTGDAWALAEDNRGQLFYNTLSGMSTIITASGPLPDNLTTQAPATAFDSWNGTAWVTDSDKLAATARNYRDDFISATDRLTLVDYSIDDKPLTTAQRSELMAARKAYKAWPTLKNWPQIELPEVPRWLLVEAVNNGYVVPAWPPIADYGAA